MRLLHVRANVIRATPPVQLASHVTLVQQHKQHLEKEHTTQVCENRPRTCIKGELEMKQSMESYLQKRYAREHKPT